jgi:hypothetical protein
MESLGRFEITLLSKLPIIDFILFIKRKSGMEISIYLGQPNGLFTQD